MLAQSLIPHRHFLFPAITVSHLLNTTAKISMLINCTEQKRGRSFLKGPLTFKVSGTESWNSAQSKKEIQHRDSCRMWITRHEPYREEACTETYKPLQNSPEQDPP